jgi:hypothetical protein
MGVINPEKRQSVQVFPNPGTGHFNILLDGFSGAATLRVFNTAGKELITRTAPFAGLTELDLSGVPNGIYILSVENNNIRQYVKLIVNH